MASKAAQSEMRIGMTTSVFGSVEIHAVVRANDVGFVIGSEKGDLRSMLTNELPGIASNLQQQNLRLAQVNFHQGSAFSGQSGSGCDSQPRSFNSRSSSSTASSNLTSPGENTNSEPTELPVPRPTVSSRGLNILA
jgi:hypothetical protein